MIIKFMQMELSARWSKWGGVILGLYKPSAVLD